jgi:hypothetical protein
MKSLVAVVALASAVAIGWFAKSRADNVPAPGSQLVYAGLVVDANTGAPLTGTHNVALTVTGANPANSCNAGSATTTFTQGHFSVPLQDGCATILRNNPGGTVDVVVDGTDFGPQKTTAVPYALQVESTGDWQSFAPSLFCVDDVPSDPTTHTTSGNFRRVGDTLDVELRSNFTGTAPCTGELGWTMPSGFSPRFAKTPQGNLSVLGWGTIDLGGTLTFVNCKVPNGIVDQVKCTSGPTSFISSTDVGNGIVNVHLHIPVQ